MTAAVNRSIVSRTLNLLALVIRPLLLMCFLLIRKEALLSRFLVPYMYRWISLPFSIRSGILSVTSVPLGRSQTYNRAASDYCHNNPGDSLQPDRSWRKDQFPPQQPFYKYPSDLSLPSHQCQYVF